MICTVAELYEMDLGAHIHVMEEWNEDAGFQWQPATVILHGYYTRVIQEDGKGGLHVASYVTHGEGDLVSLRVYTDTPKNRGSRPIVHDDAIHRCGHEYWWTPEKSGIERT